MEEAAVTALLAALSLKTKEPPIRFRSTNREKTPHVSFVVRFGLARKSVNCSCGKICELTV